MNIELSNIYGYFSTLMYSYRVLLTNGKTLFLLSSVFLAASRVFQVVAFFLPLKILILLNSDGAPRYLVDSGLYISMEELLYILTVFVPLAYLAYMILGLLSRWAGDAHIRIKTLAELAWVKKNFSHNKFMNLHSRLIRSFSDLYLILISLAIIGYFHLPAFFVCILLLISNFLIFYKYAIPAKETERLTIFKIHRKQFIEYISSANFILIFFVISFQFYSKGGDVYSAIFVLLVSRLIFQGLSRFSIESIHIYRLFYF